LNHIANSKGSTHAIPTITFFFIVLIWILLIVPLTVLGGITARMRTIETVFQHKTLRLTKNIPACPWYKNNILVILFGAIIPFMFFAFACFKD